MAQVKFDITTLTLGEAAEAETQSGKSIQQMAKSRASLLLLAVFVQELRNSEQPRSWQELPTCPYSMPHPRFRNRHRMGRQ